MISENPHIVIVEDEPVTRAKLAGFFAAEGYRVSEATNGEEMLAILRNAPADLLMLDINLPGIDGLSLTRSQRDRSDVAIILVTGRTDPIDRIVGLELGADDYVTKPFELRELLARVRSVLRRSRRGKPEELTIRRFADWTLDLTRRSLRGADGHYIDLTRAEFQLLALLTANPGTVLSRSKLTWHVSRREWDVSDRTVDVLIRRLRRKIEAKPDDPQIIVTSHGEGYMLAAKVESLTADL
ncbi:MAG: two-component system response regulator TorR [Rhodospirillaceae bacterium]|nr:MAG: two-component system response regulator TorR [Rhodospirillaceae bacterium]